MKNPFRWLKAKLSEVTRLKDGIKRKISEAHLKIRTGDCTNEQLDQATETLRSIRAKGIKIL